MIIELNKSDTFNFKFCYLGETSLLNNVLIKVMSIMFSTLLY